MPFGWWPNYHLTMNDIKFSSDVYYNTQTRDFVSLSVDESTNEIIILDSDTGEELERVSKDTFNFELYVSVNSSAVEYPVKEFNATVERMFRRLTSDLPFKDRVAFEYSRQHVEITEKENTNTRE